MILCITPNPAVDRTLYVPSVQIGEVHRADKVLVAAGGKGLNVARAIRALGGDPLCMGLLGGHTGNLLADLASREGLPAHWTYTKNETRTCIILVEDGMDATVVNERGAEVDLDAALLFRNEILEMSARANLVCLSGSLPPGFSLDVFRSLLSGLVERKKTIWVDTSGQALRTALSVNRINIKVNAAELGDVLGEEISTVEQAVKTCSQLRKHGTSSVVVTFGKNGAVLSSDQGDWHAIPPKIKTVNSVGSGDAFLGGLAVALESGYLPDRSLRQAVAAGAANALHLGGGELTYKEFMHIYNQVEIFSA